MSLIFCCGRPSGPVCQMLPVIPQMKVTSCPALIYTPADTYICTTSAQGGNVQCVPKNVLLSGMQQLGAFKSYIKHTLLFVALIQDTRACLGTTGHILVSLQCGLQSLQVLKYELKSLMQVTLYGNQNMPCSTWTMQQLVRYVLSRI